MGVSPVHVAITDDETQITIWYYIYSNTRIAYCKTVNPPNRLLSPGLRALIHVHARACICFFEVHATSYIVNTKRTKKDWGGLQLWALSLVFFVSSTDGKSSLFYYLLLLLTSTQSCRKSSHNHAKSLHTELAASSHIYVGPQKCRTARPGPAPAQQWLRRYHCRKTNLHERQENSCTRVGTGR